MQEESDFLRGQMTALYDQIEKLKSENESLDDKLQEQLCTVGSLLEENAKLIAERDELIHDRDMLKMCADHYEDELKRMHAERDEGQKILDCKFGDNIVWFLREFENAEKEYLEEGYLEIYGEDYNGREGSCEITVNEICGEAANVIESLLAEREAMMKQEPVAYEYTVNDPDTDNTFVHYASHKVYAIKSDPRPLYTHPLPAQQIPEGYALDSERLNFLAQRGARVGWGRDGEKCAVYGNELDEFNTLIRYNGSKCFDDPREAIDHAMLSASQPKGDV